ncbi:MAG TPA: SAM-dependent methyltransferase [Puia sp.]|nr:SAM-dependent methyltransferase [Puia sp.]
MKAGIVYLIPTFLDEEAIDTIPEYIIRAVKECEVFFVENERTARRFLKRLWKEIPIDTLSWFAIHKAENSVRQEFLKSLKAGKIVGILSEAGCPGIADPGQVLVATAHEAGALVKPLVGPSSLLLALMASGMNGQLFQFNGYLPVDAEARAKKIKEIESLSQKQGSTQLFIETPYRNQAMLDALLKTCRGNTRLCVGVSLTGPSEFIRTKTIAEWKNTGLSLPKEPAIFLINAAQGV